MNNLTRILDLYTQDQRVLAILDRLAAGAPSRVPLTGLAGAQVAFVLAALYRTGRTGHQLVIADDKEQAAYLQNTVAGLLESKPVLFFPDSFKRPMYFEEMNSANVLERTEVVNRLSGNTRQDAVVVTYPEALFEKVVAPSVLAEHRITVVKGNTLAVDFLTEVLVEYGFSREDFVYEPGQFSIRGAIIDVFSYGNDYPYRIELFDEEVERIRTFDPLTQLSVQTIAQVNIIPNVNTRFDRTQKVSLLDILPEGSTVWIHDQSLVTDRLQQCFEKAEAFAKSLPLLDDTELGEIFRDRAFIRPFEVTADLGRFKILTTGPLPEAENGGRNLPVAAPIDFSGRAQPSFNKNFSLLIENLNANTAKGWENFIFTDNPRQVERFHAIFDDLGAEVRFEPVMKAIHEGYVDPVSGIACYTDHQLFQRHHHYRLRQGFTADKALNLKMLRELQPGDFVVHIDHGIGKYSGLEKITVNGHTQESVRIFYKNNDVLYVSINALHKISRYTGKDGTPPVLSKLGSEAWQQLKQRTKKKVKDIARELIKLYAMRKATPGHSFPADNYLQAELEASFVFEDTPDQEKATQDVKADMMKPWPMDRLICGDVGFGKTEVAIRAAFKAVSDGKQVAILVPTTILALQHYKTFSERLADFKLQIDYINRFKTAKERRETIEKAKAGKLDILIGTHALLGKDMAFKDLGLLIIDEEQKFGVAAKEKLRKLKVNVDTLTLTATPIPRTLQFSLMAARDLSIIRTPPPNRQPIHTEIRVLQEEIIKDAIYKELQRGGQVFFVHNRVKSLPDVAALLQRLCPDADITTAHGQMEADQLETALLDFIDKKYDVLVCTNIIETGLDIPNANTMIINNAHEFGLSDLHQLRGRIGRSNKKAYCYLFTPPTSTLTQDARKRLRTIEEYSDLGSGFEIAMRDLDIRGAGNLLGAEQSGFIADIGYETFQRILEEAVQELKESDFREVFQDTGAAVQRFVRDVTIDTDVEMHLPSEYVSSVSERLSLYTALDQLETERELNTFEHQLRDRFGKIPQPTTELFEGLRLRWVARELGFERVILKDGKLRCYFLENPQSAYYDSPLFQCLFRWLGTDGARAGLHLKKSTRSLIMVKDQVRSLSAARKVLEQLRVSALPGQVAVSRTE